MTLNPARVLAFLGLALSGGVLMGAADHAAITGLLAWGLNFTGVCLVFTSGWVARSALVTPKEAAR